MWEILPQPADNFLLSLYPNQYNHSMKPVRFLGDSLERLREFPEDAKHDAGYQLEQVQRGDQPTSFKSMPSIGRGVEEIRAV
jgi:phage-related protein